jgi:hypothetical protein
MALAACLGAQAPGAGGEGGSGAHHPGAKLIFPAGGSVCGLPLAPHSASAWLAEFCLVSTLGMFGLLTSATPYSWCLHDVQEAWCLLSSCLLAGSCLRTVVTVRPPVARGFTEADRSRAASPQALEADREADRQKKEQQLAVEAAAKRELHRRAALLEAWEKTRHALEAGLPTAGSRSESTLGLGFRVCVSNARTAAPTEMLSASLPTTVRIASFSWCGL